jgi:hypothetical protein
MKSRLYYIRRITDGKYDGFIEWTYRSMAIQYNDDQVYGRLKDLRKSKRNKVIFEQVK